MGALTILVALTGLLIAPVSVFELCRSHDFKRYFPSTRFYAVLVTVGVLPGIFLLAIAGVWFGFVLQGIYGIVGARIIICLLQEKIADNEKRDLLRYPKPPPKEAST